MRTLRISIVGTLMLFASVAAHANHYSDFYVIPIAGHTPGDERLSLVENFAYPAAGLQPLTLLSAKQDGSHLFLRYRIDRER